MGLFIITVAVFAITLIGFGVSYGYGDFEDFIFAFIQAVIYSVVVFFIVGFGGIFPSSSPVKHSETEITALKDNPSTNGSFFLGTGYVSSNQYYFYIEQTEKGKKMQKVSVSESYVNEVEGVKPKVETYWKKYNSKIARFMYGDYAIFSSDEYIFYVPKDTVTNEFNIDME